MDIIQDEVIEARLERGMGVWPVCTGHEHVPVPRVSVDDRAVWMCPNTRKIVAASGARRRSIRHMHRFSATARSSGEFTQAVLQVTDGRAAVEEMKGRGVKFEEYDTAETRTEHGIARTPDGREGAWFKDSEGNLVGVVRALAG